MERRLRPLAVVRSADRYHPGHRSAAPRDHDFLAPLDLIEQRGKLVLSLEGSNLGHSASVELAIWFPDVHSSPHRHCALPTAFFAVPLPFLPIERAEVHRPGELANVARGIPCTVAVRSLLDGDELCYGPTAPRDHDLLAALNLVEQRGKLVLGLEGPNLGHHASI